MNKVFKDLMSSALAGESSKRPAKDKGKSVPRTPSPPQNIEPLATSPLLLSDNLVLQKRKGRSEDLTGLPLNGRLSA